MDSLPKSEKKIGSVPRLGASFGAAAFLLFRGMEVSTPLMKNKILKDGFF
jgi:hypothetical protein